MFTKKRTPKPEHSHIIPEAQAVPGRYLKTNDNRNYGLDIARALAISLALFVHLYDNFIRIDFLELWYLGYFGMDIFFVLSGFLIGGILIKLFDTGNGALTPSQTGVFLLRRWFRTVPLYYTMLVINILAGKFILHTISSPDWRFFLWLQNLWYYPKSFFGEAWSLSAEEWFYFSFSTGLCLFSILTSRWRIKSVNKILIFTISYIVIFNIVRLSYAAYDYTEYNIVLFRLDAIAYGVVAAILYNYFRHAVVRRLFAIGLVGLIISAIGVLLFLLQPKIGKPYIIYYPLIGIGLSMCILFLYEWSDRPKKKPFFKSVNFISRISYSIYLVNMVAIYLIISFIKIETWQGGILAFLIGGCIVFLLALFTYHVIELPFLKFRDKHIHWGKKKKSH